MTDRALQHRRLHKLLRIQKLLALREGSSPFTLLLDSVEQSAKPLVRQYIRNAKVIPSLSKSSRDQLKPMTGFRSRNPSPSSSVLKRFARHQTSTSLSKAVEKALLRCRKSYHPCAPDLKVSLPFQDLKLSHSD